MVRTKKTKGLGIAPEAFIDARRRVLRRAFDERLRACDERRIAPRPGALGTLSFRAEQQRAIGRRQRLEKGREPAAHLGVTKQAPRGPAPVHAASEPHLELAAREAHGERPKAILRTSSVEP